METRVAAPPAQEELRASFRFTLAQEPGLLDRLAEHVVAAWNLPLLRSAWAHAALLTTVAAICAARAFIGLGSMQMFSHDAFMPLDGAWRLLNGQRPHIDFYSFIGVLAYAPTALAMLISHNGPNAFGYGQALQSLALGMWAYVLARKRIPGVPGVLFTLAITLLAATPFALGYAPLELSPATTYNRYGYAAIALIMLEAFAQRRRSDFWGGVSTGSLLVILFFLKMSYFAGAVVLVAALVPCRVQTLQRWIGIGLGTAALTFPFCAYFSFQFTPMFRDLAMVAGAKRVHLRAYHFDSIFTDAAAIAGFGAVTALVLLSSQRARSARATLIATLAVCLTGLVLIFSNCEPHGLPLSLFFVLIAAGQFDFRTSGIPHLFRAVVLVWASVFALAVLTPSVLAFAYAASVKAPDALYQAYVDDGLELLRHNRKPDDTVMSLDFTNPFSFALGMKPARGGTTALQFQTTFGEAHRPSAEWLFGSAKLVIVPKTFSDGSLQDSIPRLYGPYLNSHFKLVAESAQWRLYRALDG